MMNNVFFFFKFMDCGNMVEISMLNTDGVKKKEEEEEEEEEKLEVINA